MARMKDIEGVRTGDLFKVHPAQIKEDPTFNIRLNDEDYEEGVDRYTQMIMGGSRVPAIEVYTIGEDIILIDGHRRRRATLRAIERGYDVRDIDCVLRLGNDADRVVRMLNSGAGRSWLPIERLEGYKRLRSFGYSEKEIASSVGMTEQHVRGILELADADTAVQQMVRSGSVAATEAIREVRKSGRAAAGNLTAAVDKAHAAGKTRATAKHIAQAKGAPSGSSVFAAARNAVLEEAAVICDKVALASRPFGDGGDVDQTATELAAAIRALKAGV